MIKRIFHPIGQGAFYSERHENFNIVYDCGNWKNTNLANKIVKQAFLKDEVIDILFISHFDYDHVNKIKILKEHAKIKKVIMPLLHKEETTLLINLYRILKYPILTLIKNPQKFFGQETQIITVKPSKYNDTPIDDITPIDIDDLGDETNIESGTILKKSFKSYEWIYIPFNYEYKTRNKKLEDLLNKEGFDVEKLKSDPNYTLGEIVKDVDMLKIKGGKIFKQIYDSSEINGNINENSMLLYSGINANYNESMKKKCYCNHYLNCLNTYDIFEYKKIYNFMKNDTKVSCIYTGDTDLNKVKIKTIFRSFWKSVGTIQIPHHGDIKSFDESVLDDKYYFCPISVGNNNSYGHPSSKLVADIAGKDSFPILVTEDMTSCFVEYIMNDFFG